MFSNDKVISQGSKYSETYSDIDDKTLKSVKKYSEFFADLAMQEYEFLASYRPSVVALACIICSR